MLGSLALLSKLAIVLPDLTFKGLIDPRNNSHINYMLGCTIYLGPNAVMTVGLSSHKFIFLYYFRMTYYQEGLFFDKRSIKKL